MKKSRNLWLMIVIGCLITNASSSSGKKDMTGIFPEIPGMSKIRTPEIYTPDNLYEYINGAAELYLSYDFRELVTLTYENAKEQSLTIEIYRHSSSPNGFGIYAQERPQSGDFLKIGTQGYYEKGTLNFVRGSYYVKLICFGFGSDDKSLLISVAQKVANQLEGELSFPRIVYSFPEEGKIKNSEKFISQNFLGHSFLRSAFTADYKDANTTFKLFIIKGADAKDCEEMLTKYLQFAKIPVDTLQQGRNQVSDPYHGDVLLSWQGEYIAGVLYIEQEKLRQKYIKILEINLTKLGRKK